MRTIALVLPLSACAVLPADGAWTSPPGDVLLDDCGLYTRAGPGTTDVRMTHTDLTRFTLSLNGSDPVDCARTGADFVCDTVVQTVDLFVVRLDNAVVLTGRFLDGFHAEGEITAEATCEGSACDQLDSLGLTLPCATRLSWEASFTGG